MEYQLAFKIKNWIENRPYWQFFIIIYFLRWLILLPIVFTIQKPASIDTSSLSSMPSYSIILLFLYALIFGPLIETFIECFLPFKILKHIQKEAFRPWILIVTSGILMTILHPIGAAIPSFITGVFLAYNFLRFSNKNQSFAFLSTTLFHTLINIVSVSVVLYRLLLS